MTGDELSAEPLPPGALDEVETLLEANDLPTEGIRSDPVSIYGLRAEDRLIGAAGLEVYDSAGLLRSVVVRESHRGQGHGRRLVRALEDRAASQGVETLYLLTTTAADVFAALGYRERERAAAPASIERTSEFAEVCPAEAVFMQKRLSSAGPRDPL